MAYTVKELATLAGVSSRTLRYYDEIGLLKPTELNASGYRLYRQKEVDLLQQIMFYKSLGVRLQQIKKIVLDPNFDEIEALKQHRQQLIDKRQELESLLTNVNRTLKLKECGEYMSEKDKFEGFKARLIEENERKYGEEVRNNYGDQSVDDHNKRIKKMTKQDHESMTELSNQILDLLHEAYKTGDAGCELARRAVHLHRQWIEFYWGNENYSKEAHANLGSMYVEDERFKAYYDRKQGGIAEFLRDAIHIYTGNNNHTN